MLNSKTKYGFYSEIQVRLNGTSIYSTPNGKEVEVTAVGYSPDGSGCCQQPDKIPLGKVVDWLRKGREVPNQHIICYPK